MSVHEVPSPLLPQPLEVRQRLAASLRVEADALEHEGYPPSTSLIQSLIDFLHTEERLAQKVAAETAEAELIRQAAAEEAERVRQRRREQTELVRQRLQRFQCIGCQDTNLELEHQQRLAAQLEQRLPLSADDPEEETFRALLDGEHSWMQLLKLVSEHNALTDAEWDHLSERVRGSFESSLANAALRGRLAIVSPPDATVVEPSHADEVADVATGDTASSRMEPPFEPSSPVEERNIPPLTSPPDEEEHVSSGSVFDELTESKPSISNGSASLLHSSLLASTVRPSNESGDLHNALFDGHSETDAGDSNILRQRLHFDEPAGPSCELATEILAADNRRRAELLPELIQALIFEGRSGLAYHLACSMVSTHPSTPQFLPPWAIRAWTIGNAVLFPTGQLAGRLQEDFAQMSPKAVQAASPEQALAVSLFIRAAALRPAVIAPATRAAHVLRSFEMSPETSKLYNYCMRVGTYGEKLQGITPASFKRTEVQSTGKESLQQLHDDVRFWLNDSSSYSVRYSVSSPLFTRAHWSLRTSTTRRYAAEIQTWQQWQDTLQTAHRIIRNILQDRVEAVVETRHEMDRLALLTTGDRSPLSLQSNEDMRNYLLQTITFGQRWVSLHSSSNLDSFVPEDLGELRSEIERRHDAVAEELRDLADRYPQPEVQMALGCLMLAMDQLRDLVDPDVPTETQEPDARHLVHSELLKVPGLQFSSNWQPEADPESLLDTILTYLADPNPDWITAVQLQLGRDNLDAAEKISTLPVWNRTEQAQLQTVLSRYRKQLRDELWKDLQETEALIEDATRLQLFSEQDRVGFSARLERLRRGLSLSRHHAGDAHEIAQLRNAVERRRSREATLTRERLEKLETTGGTNLPPPRKGWTMDF